jgi:hypothetical protein
MNKETCSNNYIAKDEHQSFKIIRRSFLQMYHEYLRDGLRTTQNMMIYRLNDKLNNRLRSLLGKQSNTLCILSLSHILRNIFLFSSTYQYYFLL